MVLWLTGLSGSGKSTIAEEFVKRNENFVLLDGDVLRNGLCKDLGFSDEDRVENLRRIREVCKLFVKEGKNVITAFISPFEEDRQLAKKEIPNCYVINVECPLEVCEQRDVKGLYKKVRAGEIPQFTGISSPFENSKADLILNTDVSNLERCVNGLIIFCKGKK